LRKAIISSALAPLMCRGWCLPLNPGPSCFCQKKNGRPCNGMLRLLDLRPEAKMQPPWLQYTAQKLMSIRWLGTVRLEKAISSLFLGDVLFLQKRKILQLVPILRGPFHKLFASWRLLHNQNIRENRSRFPGRFWLSKRECHKR